MRVLFKPLIILLSLLFIYSCATFKKQVNVSKEQLIKAETKDIEHRLYLIGDAGYLDHKKENHILKQLKDSLAKETLPSTVLFLGDNIYPKGMPTKDNKKRAEAEKVLQQQIDIVEDFIGKTIFIPGNHDWYSNGVKGLKRQEKFVENQLGKNSFLPKNGCPIEKEEIGDDIVLLIVDSQWYITNWDKHPKINDNCSIKSKAKFLDELQSEIKKARGKTTIIAIHHPLFSNGPHGGQYAFADHLKPFPIIGTIKNVLRKTTGISNADISNKHYNDLRKKLIAMAQHNDQVIVVSGHEHSLQYIVVDDIPQIISGSASKKTVTRATHNTLFSHGENGYAVLDVFKDGSSSVKFITPNEVSYQTSVHSSTKNKKYEFNRITQDSIAASVYTNEEVKKSKFHQFLWGKRFRNAYGVDVKVPIAYLDTLKGGLKPFRKGGGTQSKSLHLKDTNGIRYLMRAVKKQGTQYLQATIFKDEYIQPELKNTTAEELVKDVFTGSYPYAPLIIGELSEAINLAYLNPQLLYLPKQNELGDFNDEFGDELYILEEHASEGHMHLGNTNFTGEIISTDDMFEEIMKDESIQVDQEAYIKARLFDMLIGDWDRHQDQWRWMLYKENGTKIYRPLPRDRDQAFSKMSDGFLMGAAVRLIPQAKLLRKYESNIKSIDGFNFEPLPIDISILKTLDKSVWDKQVAYIVENINDNIINNAFNGVPKELQDETIEYIKTLLKSRKENLSDIADRYFTYLSKCRIIKATNKDDYIQVNPLKNNQIEIKISRIIKGEIESPFYTEIFNSKQTKELWIYGLDDTDTFEVTGKIKKMKIRLIGGQNNDTYKVGKGKNIAVNDFKSKKNDVSQAQNATLKLRDDYELNTYDYKKYKYRFQQILPKIGYNPDEGFILGASYSNTIYGLERNPFSSQHKIGAAYFTATSGFEINYNGEFAHILRNVNFVIDASYNTPKFSINFFGFGNDTQNNDDELGLDFNRTLIEQFTINPSLKWKSYGGAEISSGIKYQSVKVENTVDRIIEDNTDVSTEIFKTQHFGTVNTLFSFENLDNNTFPTMGINTQIETGFTQNLSNSSKNFFYLTPELSIDHKLISSGKLVLASKVKSHLNFSSDLEYYQGASIGGNDGLRGFRNQRFTGQKSFYQSTDLRYALGSLKNNIIPMQYGGYVGFDYGRVWVENDTSNRWHNAYGGGLFLSIAGTLAAQIGLFNSIEGWRFNFSLGFDF